MSERVDRTTRGHRTAVLGAFALVAAGSDWVAEYLEWEAATWGAWSALALLWAIFLVGTGWVSTFRDDDDNWQLSPLLESGQLFVEHLPGRAQDIWAWTTAAAATGVVALAGRQVLRLIDLSTFGQLTSNLAGAIVVASTVGFLAMLFAAVFLLAGLVAWLRRDTSDGRDKRDEAPTSVAGLPVWITRAELAQHARLCTQPMIRALLQHLHGWPAGRRWKNEHTYSNSLLYLLRRRAKGWRVKRESFIGVKNEGTRGRADLVIEDSVLVELKRSLTTSTADRAMGQVQRYAANWTAGPVILLFVERLAAEQRRRVEASITALRAEGRQVLVLELGV